MYQSLSSLSEAVLTGVVVMASATQYQHADGTFLKTGEAVVQVALYSNAESDLQKRFARLTQSWKEGTWYMSSARNIAKHSSYQEIIRMGPAVVPLILGEMRQHPAPLVLGIEHY